MEEVVLVIHLILALAIIGLVLLQRSEGGGLGIGSSGGMGSFASARTTANVLTRATGICAMLFFATSLILGILTGQQSRHSSLMDKLDTSVPEATAPAVPGNIGDKPSTDTGSAPAAIPGKNDAAPALKAESAPEKKPVKSKPVAPVSR
jgi:preprotein translocase subunit SecG